ncbi:MAG: hypothetical protein LBD97_02510 [Bifidobacteriaceae bacterium]|jgi:hypothetical protein|nr:hypothetical protein [Bifidobacteriaceae bacterium]
MVFLRADKPPRHVLDTLAAPKGGRTLASAVLGDGTWLVATTLGLAVWRADGARFHPWDRIDRAVLRRRGAQLSVTFSGEATPELFAIEPKDKRFASILNERLQASVVEVQHVETPSGQVIVALRRDPADQSLHIQEIWDDAVDRPAAAALVKAARDRLGEAAGLPRSAW